MLHQSIPSCLACLVFIASPASAQTTWYVDVNATPPGNGSQSSPYTSIQYAHNQTTTHAFDTLLVAPGTYVENVQLSKRVTVRATGGAEVTTLRPATAGPILTLNGIVDAPESITFEGFTITGVFGPANTGAVYSFDGKLLRCIVRGNHGSNYRGVDTAYDSFLVDCTIADNDFAVDACGFMDAIWMKNCIVWGNGTNQVPCSGGTFLTDITYCAGGPFGSTSPTNITGDPELWNLDAGDYHLRPGSPCIDAGDPALPNDPDGSRSDIGYYAFDSGYAFGPQNYCTGKMNSDGCVPVIAASGLASLTNPNPFLITASLVLPGRRSLLIYSLSQAAVPFQGATLCIEQPFRRVGGQVSQGTGTCGGSLAYDFNLRIQSGTDPALVPGVLVYAQWWYRDPFDATGFGSGLTDGLGFGIAP